MIVICIQQASLVLKQNLDKFGMNGVLEQPHKKKIKWSLCATNDHIRTHFFLISEGRFKLRVFVRIKQCCFLLLRFVLWVGKQCKC